jgi:maltose alpha-D-glucosyltransferase/alpha-amylase
MQWNSDKNAGFSDADPSMLYLPVIEDDTYHYTKINVKKAEEDEHSLLHWMRRIISIRRQYRVFGRGEFMFTDADHPSVLSYWRIYPKENILVVANLSAVPQRATILLNRSGYQGILQDLFLGQHFHAEEDRLEINLHPFEFLWLTEVQPEEVLMTEDKLVLSID